MNMTESNIIEQWASKYPEVVSWLAKLQVKELNALSLYHFCQWANKNPTELLALKSNPASLEIEKLLDAYVAAKLSDTNALRFWRVNAVKSFFKYSYVSIAKAAGNIQLVKTKDYNRLSKEGLKRLWDNTYNLRDRALITFVCSTAIAKETLGSICWKHLQDDWETVELPSINLPPEILKGHGRGKYAGVRQITFLTPESKRDLVNYKVWLEQKIGRKVTADDHIWLETMRPYRPVSYDALGFAIWQLSKRTGVPFSLHDGRRWVTTALEQVAISQNWARVLRGRKVAGAESPYSRPNIEALRAKFKEAVGLLEFTTVTATPTVPKEVADKLAALEQEQTELKRRYGIMRERTKGWKQVAKNRNVCKDSKNCQRIVSEDELPTLLSGGWRVVTCLSSGKVVVSNET